MLPFLSQRWLFWWVFGFLFIFPVKSWSQAPIRALDRGFFAQYGLFNRGQVLPVGPTLPGADISAPLAWGLALPGHEGDCTSVPVAVIDTGIDLQHPDLQNSIATNDREMGLDGQGNDRRFNNIDDDQNGFVDDWRGWNFVSNTNNIGDDNYHGTHVSGIIGAQSDLGGVTGVCRRAKIFSIKATDNSAGGSIFDIIEAIHYLAEFTDAQGNLIYRISNNSYGAPGLFLTGIGPSFENAIQTYVGTGRRGGIFVAAAGNYSWDTDQWTNCGPYNCWGYYPANFVNPRIVAVAASNAMDEMASFSNWGTTSVDLAAPGERILSSTPLRSTAYMQNASIRSGWDFVSGTSMATPMVVGAAAYVWALHPSLDADQVIQRILQRGDPLNSLSARTVTGRRLNVHQAAF